MSISITDQYHLTKDIELARVAARQFRIQPRPQAVAQYCRLLDHMFPLMAYAPEVGKDLADGTENRHVTKMTDRVHPDILMFALSHSDGSIQRSTALSNRTQPFTVAERNANILRWQAKQAAMAAAWSSPDDHERLHIDAETTEYLGNKIFTPRTKWATLQDLIDNKHKFTEGDYWRPRMRQNLPLALKKLKFELAREKIRYRRMQTAHMAINRLVNRIMALPSAKREELFKQFGGSEYLDRVQGRMHTLEAARLLTATIAASRGIRRGTADYSVDQTLAATIFHSLASRPTRKRENRELVLRARKEKRMPRRPKFPIKRL